MSLGSDTLVHVTPTAHLRADINIVHPQLRDLVQCTNRRGLVTYTSGFSIYEHDMTDIDIPRRRLAQLSFEPNCLAASSEHSLIAAGGPKSEVYIASLNSSNPWNWSKKLPGASINNSVIFTTLSSTLGRVSSLEPRVVLSNNDKTVKFYSIATHIQEESPSDRLDLSGIVRLDTAVNHASISPDGSTLLAAGDTPAVHLFHISGGPSLTFDPITSYCTSSGVAFAHPHHEAIFSTAFSSCGRRFAVGSQDGVVNVWDVRSSKRLAVFRNQPRPTSRRWSDRDCMGSPWGVRKVLFTPGEAGKELLVFTEHNENFHVVDALTFNEHQVIHLPPLANVLRGSASPKPLANGARESSSPSPSPRSPQPTSPSSRGMQLSFRHAPQARPSSRLFIGAYLTGFLPYIHHRLPSYDRRVHASDRRPPPLPGSSADHILDGGLETEATNLDAQSIRTLSRSPIPFVVPPPPMSTEEVELEWVRSSDRRPLPIDPRTRSESSRRPLPRRQGSEMMVQENGDTPSFPADLFAHHYHRHRMSMEEGSDTEGYMNGLDFDESTGERPVPMMEDYSSAASPPFSIYTSGRRFDAHPLVHLPPTATRQNRNENQDDRGGDGDFEMSRERSTNVSDSGVDGEESENVVDITGVSFSPSGEHLYVGTTRGVIEWATGAGGRRWFFGDVDEGMR